MQKIITTHASSKYQVTIPKEARQILGIQNSGEPLGFIIDPEAHIVKLTRINIIPSDEEFTDTEYQKLIQLAEKPGGKLLKTTKKAIRFHKKLTKK